MKKLGFILLAVFMTTSCGKLGQQDPLAGQPDWIKDAKPIGTDEKPKGPTVINDSEMLIIGSSPMSFKETVESSYSFNARVVTASRVITASKIWARNLAQFPGATFTMDASGTNAAFKWTPPRGFTDSDSTKEINLQVLMDVRQKGDDTPYVKEVSYVVRVSRVEGVPTVVEVEDLVSSPTIEGKSKSFKVKVKDEDALGQTGPALAVVQSQSGSSIAALVRSLGPAKRNQLDPTIWEFSMELNLYGMEVTPSASTFTFGLVAYNRFGKASAVRDVQARVWTELSDPVSGVRTVTMEATKQTIVNFTIQDPKGEGSLGFTIPKLDSLPGPANKKTLTCNNTSSSFVNCVFMWTPPLEAINKNYKVDMLVTARSTISGDTRTRQKSISLPISVVAPVESTTTTIPQPTSTVQSPPPPSPAEIISLEVESGKDVSR